MYILRLNTAGQPVEWLTWQEAVCLYSRALVCWSLGDVIYRIHGGCNRWLQDRTIVELPSIIACGGKRLFLQHHSPTLTNASLFARDNHQCMYCGSRSMRKTLTRDHVVPKSKGGVDNWVNVVAACRRCNQFKGDNLLEETSMSLIALPYRPNAAEYLTLVNSQRILPDQADYLSSQFSKNCRWQMKNSAKRASIFRPN